MTISPFEVERQEFGTAAMGYRKKDVDHFLQEVKVTLVGLWQERADLREENERLVERIARFESLEDQLKSTLMLAQDSAEKATDQARRDAELTMRESSQKAREIVHEAHEERARLDRALRELQLAETEARQRFRQLASSVLTHLDESEEDRPDVSKTGAYRAIVQDVAPVRAPSPVPRGATPPAPAVAPALASPAIGSGGSRRSEVFGTPPTFQHERPGQTDLATTPALPPAAS